MADIEAFRGHIIAGGVRDPKGIHYEFVSGMHGQKLDFDTIPDDSELYHEWILNAADFIKEEFPNLPEIILGVANGTNRVARDTAKHFGGKVIGAVSRKNPVDSKTLFLPADTERLIKATRPNFVVVIEDVGTTGSNSVQVAKHALRVGAQAVEVVSTWQRRERLERLEEAGVPYRAIIDEPLTTYTEEECESVGYCAKNWKLIRRGE